MTYANATHELRCRHAIGKNGTTYWMRCHVVGVPGPGKLRVLVFGARNWKGYETQSRRRTVPSHRVRERNTTCG